MSSTPVVDRSTVFYPGSAFALDRQTKIRDRGRRPVFLFLNIGETHVPYYFAGADWDPGTNPCVPFGANNDRAECRRRQVACVEFIDARLARLLAMFAQSTIAICADHGDCWGEDGVWEHGVSHPKVFEVPLLFRLGQG